MGTVAQSHPELERLDLRQLVDRLDDLEDRRTPVGWSPDDAVEKAAVERRIMQLVGHVPPGEERRSGVRLSCEMSVRMRTRNLSVRAQVTDIGAGGVFVTTDTDFTVGTVVELEVRGSGTDEHGLRVRGEVAWIAPGNGGGVGVCFNQTPTSAHEQRIRRFVIELLRHRVAN